jgi:hypothetical protein
MRSLLVAAAWGAELTRIIPDLWVKDQAATVTYQLSVEEETHLVLKDSFTNDIYFNINNTETYTIEQIL